MLQTRRNSMTIELDKEQCDIIINALGRYAYLCESVPADNEGSSAKVRNVIGIFDKAMKKEGW
jgi:hypothetical protein